MDELVRIKTLLNHPSTDITKVAKETNLSRATLYSVRSGKLNISLATLNALRAWAKGKRVSA